MAVSQTSKAGINCLHYQSSEPIYTGDKYGKLSCLCAAANNKNMKPSVILKCTLCSLYRPAFEHHFCSNFLHLITCSSALANFFFPQCAPELTSFILHASSLVALSDPSLSSCIRLKPGARRHDQTCQWHWHGGTAALHQHPCCVSTPFPNTSTPLHPEGAQRSWNTAQALPPFHVSLAHRLRHSPNYVCIYESERWAHLSIRSASHHRVWLKKDRKTTSSLL